MPRFPGSSASVARVSDGGRLRSPPTSRCTPPRAQAPALAPPRHPVATRRLAATTRHLAAPVAKTPQRHRDKRCMVAPAAFEGVGRAHGVSDVRMSVLASAAANTRLRRGSAPASPPRFTKTGRRHRSLPGINSCSRNRAAHRPMVRIRSTDYLTDPGVAGRGRVGCLCRSCGRRSTGGTRRCCGSRRARQRSGRS